MGAGGAADSPQAPLFAARAACYGSLMSDAPSPAASGFLARLLSLIHI